MFQLTKHLEELRKELRREHLCAFVFPSSDPHNSEYTAERWKGREWISGFDGSAGTAVVTLRSAALWTDSRYFIAADRQLTGTEFQLMKEKVEGTPTIAEWLGCELADEADKAIDTETTNNYYSLKNRRNKLCQYFIDFIRTPTRNHRLITSGTPVP